MTTWQPKLLRTNSNSLAWYVVRGWEFLRTPAGNMRKFRSEEAAQAASNKAIEQKGEAGVSTESIQAQHTS